MVNKLKLRPSKNKTHIKLKNVTTISDYILSNAVLGNLKMGFIRITFIAILRYERSRILISKSEIKKGYEGLNKQHKECEPKINNELNPLVYMYVCVCVCVCVWVCVCVCSQKTNFGTYF